MKLRSFAHVHVLALTFLLSPQSPAALPAPDPDNGAIALPPGFQALVVADNLGPLRFMTVAANGDIYVKTQRKGVIALRDTHGDGRADVKKEFGSGGGTGIALHDGWLYHSTNDAVYRYKLTPGELAPTGEPETIVRGLPDGRQHNAKSFIFGGDGQLYVEVGSPSNSFGDPDRALGAKGGDPTEFLRTHGGFWRFDPNKLNQSQADGFHFSTGHRHILSVAWNPAAKSLFFVMMGRDQLNTVAPQYYNDQDNAERVGEEMHQLNEGANFGWPFTYYDVLRKERMVAPEYGGNNNQRAEPGKWPNPLVAFPAHWAPLQMAFYGGEQFPAKYRGGAFIAFHGSWNRAPLPQAGYCVGFVPCDEKGMPRGTYEVFANGFAGREVLMSPRDARFRACGLAVGPDGSLYVADSEKGRVWRIIYTGEKSKNIPATPTPEPAKTTDNATPDGAKIYAQNCATCHMADGSGVPNLQPALAGSAVVSGDSLQLVRVLLLGPAKVLPADRDPYSNTMPAFAQLPDAEIAAVLSHIRKLFGEGASPITTSLVTNERTPPIRSH